MYTKMANHYLLIEFICFSDFGSYTSDMFMCYEHKCQSEIIRQMKGSRVLGISVDPILEKGIGEFLGSFIAIMFKSFNFMSNLNMCRRFHALFFLHL